MASKRSVGEGIRYLKIHRYGRPGLLPGFSRINGAREELHIRSQLGLFHTSISSALPQNGNVVRFILGTTFEDNSLHTGSVGGGGGVGAFTTTLIGHLVPP